MSHEPDDALDSSFEPRTGAPASLAATRPLYWSVRRELWENRSIYIAPVAVAALTLFGFLISTIRLPERMRAAAALDPIRQQEAILQPYSVSALLIMAATFLVAVFYCLDALQGERRDRSILFWKSLPVSDLTTVLSKASIPLVVLPLVTFAVTVLTQTLMLLVSSLVLLGSDIGLAALWSRVPLVQMWVLLFYHLLTIHVLWYAPIYGWLLLVSAWSRRAAFLWAGLPLLAICVVEKMAFNTSHAARLLAARLGGGPEAAEASMGSLPLHELTHLTPGQFLASPGLWIGLALAIVCLAAAARLRRHRDPI